MGACVGSALFGTLGHGGHGSLHAGLASLAQAAGRDWGLVRALKCFGEDTHWALSLVPSLTHSHSHTDTESFSLVLAHAPPRTRACAHLSPSPPSLAIGTQSRNLGWGSLHSAKVLPRIKCSLAPHWPCTPPPHPNTQSEPLVPFLSLLGGVPSSVLQRTSHTPWELWLCLMGCCWSAELGKIRMVN